MVLGCACDSEVNYKGYLDMKEGEEEAWCRRYCVLREGELSVLKVCSCYIEPFLDRLLFWMLRYLHFFVGAWVLRAACLLGVSGVVCVCVWAVQEAVLDEEEEVEEERTCVDERVLIQLDSVASVRTAVEFGDCAFQIVTPDVTYFFRSDARQEMQVRLIRASRFIGPTTDVLCAVCVGVQEWLFAFHRSLAVIVARLVDSSSPSGSRRWANRTTREGEGSLSRKAQMLKELGHGHGRSLSVTRRFRRASNYEGGSALPGAGGGEPLRGGAGGGQGPPPHRKRDSWGPGVSQPLPVSSPPGPCRVRSAEPCVQGQGLMVMSLRDERTSELFLRVMARHEDDALQGGRRERQGVKHGVSLSPPELSDLPPPQPQPQRASASLRINVPHSIGMGPCNPLMGLPSPSPASASASSGGGLEALPTPRDYDYTPPLLADDA